MVDVYVLFKVRAITIATTIITIAIINFKMLFPFFLVTYKNARFIVPIWLPPFSTFIIANAVAYTKPGKTISVYFSEREIIIENECTPISTDALSHIFEPFYRPDFDRNRDNNNGIITSQYGTSMKRVWSG